jgi:hypothetical protein
VAVGSIQGQLDDAALRLVSRWGALLRALDQWPLDHASHRHPLQGMAEALSDLHRAGGRVRLVLRGDHLQIDGRRVVATAATRAQLLVVEAHLRERSMDGVEVWGLITPDLVKEFVGVLLDASTSGVAFVNAVLPSRGIVELSCIAREDGAAASRAEAAMNNDERLVHLYLRGIRATDRMAQGEPLAVVGQELARVLATLASLYPRHPALLLALVGAGRRLPYDQRHALHVALLALGLGYRLGLDEPACLEVALCAVAVDCGMASVPVELRRAQRGLDADEQALVRLHPLHSVRVLLPAAVMSGPLQRRLLVAFEHHLGSPDGYPAAIDWPRPHLYSRIVAVADAFDAVSSDRWRPGRSPSAALAELRRDARLDVDVLDQLGVLVGEFGLQLAGTPGAGVHGA